MLILILTAAVATASTVSAPQFRVNVDEGVIIVSDVNRGRVLGKTTFDRWGAVAPTQDQLRHAAAAVIAGQGQRERSVNPNSWIYTLAEKTKTPHVTATFERGAIFVLFSDTQTNRRYEALVYMAKITQASLPAVADR